MKNAEETHAPIRQSVRVECPIEEAFRLFTEKFSAWWPLASYSFTGQEAEYCEIEPWKGGRVFERTRSGEEHEWGSVIAWNPPEHLEFAWRSDAPSDKEQTVRVEFNVEADGTRVTVIHTNWQLSGVQTCALQAALTAQWPLVLERCFAAFVSEEMLVAV